jgi:shikimate kinase
VIFLVGFMGAGKTSVGRSLGEHLKWEFEDLDDRIERNEGRTVMEIFSNSGESAFRRAETFALGQVLQEVGAGVRRVVALGGGAFVQRANAALLKSAGVPTIFLDAAVDDLWGRCAKQACDQGTSRPLLGDRQRFTTLHQRRRKAYMSASIKIDTTGKQVEVISREIAHVLGLKARSQKEKSN